MINKIDETLYCTIHFEPNPTKQNFKICSSCIDGYSKCYTKWLCGDKNDT